MSPATRVLVTRPAAEAARWVAQLQALGAPAQALPLIDIAPVADPAPLRAAWQQLGDYAALMFVSSNAVQHFMAARPAEAGAPATWPRAWAPGPGTARALQQAGWPAERIDTPAPDAAQFDSETLWPQIAAQVQPGVRVLMVRGADAEGQGAGRHWLADQVSAAGGQVEWLSTYRRLPPVWDEATRTQAQIAASDGSLWLFSSSEAIHNLRALLPDQDWRAARALATHPRIAATARQQGWGQVAESRPALDAVWASIKSPR